MIKGNLGCKPANTILKSGACIRKSKIIKQPYFQADKFLIPTPTSNGDRAMVSSESNENDQVTVVVSQLVKPGCEQAYEQWIQGIYSDARLFVGHLGINIIRPQTSNDPEYAIIFKFDCYANMKIWMESDVRKQWIKQAENLVQGSSKVETLTGMEAWFSLPGKPQPKPPKRYKMFLISWFWVYVLLNILKYLIGPAIVNLPFQITSLINSVIIVGLLTYLIMPRMTKLLYKWLYPK